VTLVQDLKAIRFIKGTKVSHDYLNDDVKTFSYRELVSLDTPAIGIPCRQNHLIVVDVDVEGVTHKHDGREFWTNFCKEYDMPPTYTVRTPSGGYHFYYRLPEYINPDTFSPPASLSQGVDLKWNGWVGAPPTAGYDIHYGTVSMIQEVPKTLLDYISSLIKGKPTKTFDVLDNNAVLELHKPFSEAQIKDLKTKIDWLQTNGSLSRSEWRDGLFALKAGIDDPVLLDEMVEKWTMNKSYVPGDEDQARAIVAKANKQGPIGPGSIFAILRQIAIREGAPAIETPFTTQEIFDRAKVQLSFHKDGSIKIESSESNAAALVGALFDDKMLYHDIRTDLYIYKGRSYSDADLVNMFLPIIQSPTFGLGLEKFRRQTVASGIDVLMASRRKDPHLEYLKSLEWDGVPRIEKFFVDYVGVENNEYHRIVGKNFWTSLAARGLQPGCKFDSMVVLEGHEGIMKSSLVEAIGGEYTFAPSRRDALDNVDELRKMHQSVIVELPELMGLVNESPEKVKAFLAKPFDHIRALFARKAVKNLRGFVFVGTTNSDKYLSSAMGVRRFWPVRIPKTVKAIKLSQIKADKDQLFAEGIHMFKEGYKYWEMPLNYLISLVEDRIVEEPLIQPIKEMLPTLGDKWTSSDVYRRLESLGYISKGFSNAIVQRIDTSLVKLGCVKRHDPSQRAVLWQAIRNEFRLDDLF
jgi:hypothetical protein